jgi:hypothetical protein
MKTENSNTISKVIGTTLMLIGAGTVLSYISSKRNRNDIQEKAAELGDYLIGIFKEEKDNLGKKANELISKARDVNDEIDGQLSKYEKKTF